MADTYLRHLESLKYVDPVPILIRYRELEREVAASDLPPAVRALRTPDLKSAREGREAALFAHGLAQVVGRKVFVARHESSDFDFVVAWSDADRKNYCPVQLKELVSKERNQGANISALLERVSNGPSTNTALLVRLNRCVDVNIAQLPLAGFPFRELWFLWQSNPDASRWSILGDALTKPVRHDFDYPASGGDTV